MKNIINLNKLNKLNLIDENSIRLNYSDDLINAFEHFDNDRNDSSFVNQNNFSVNNFNPN